MTIAFGNGWWAAGLGIVIVVGAVLTLNASLALAFALAALVVATLLRHDEPTRRRTGDRGDPLHAARVELARARRQNEEADVLVALFSGPAASAGADPLGALRITDGVGVLQTGRALEICVVVSGDDAARPAIERRLSRLSATPSRMAWARFPSDGVTLESLIAFARARLTEPRLPKAAVTRNDSHREHSGSTGVGLGSERLGSTVSVRAQQGSLRELSR